MEPSIGQIVHYRLTTSDANAINKRRKDFEHTRNVAVANTTPLTPWPGGTQAHVGNMAQVGEVVAMMVVRCWHEPGKYQRGASMLNGQVFLDGNDQHWVGSVYEGVGPGTWSWPPKV